MKEARVPDHQNEPEEFAGLAERRHIERRHYRQKPESQDDTISELWFAIVGVDGEGLNSRMDNLESAFTELVRKLNGYLRRGRKESCFYLVDRSKQAVIRVESRRSFTDWVKFALGEGVKIGIALGVFSAIGRLLGFVSGG